MITPNTRYRFVKETRLAHEVSAPAGYEFTTDAHQAQVGDIMKTGKTVSAYALHNWLEDGRIELVGRFRPSDRDTYFFITDTGLVTEYIWRGSPQSKARHAFGNCFETRQEAEEVRDMLREVLVNLRFDDYEGES